MIITIMRFVSIQICGLQLQGTPGEPGKPGQDGKPVSGLLPVGCVEEVSEG